MCAVGKAAVVDSGDDEENPSLHGVPKPIAVGLEDSVSGDWTACAPAVAQLEECIALLAGQ